MANNLYLEFVEELIDFSSKWVTVDFESMVDENENLESKPLGVAAFFSIVGFFQMKDELTLHKMDELTLKYAHEEDANPKPLKKTGETQHPVFLEWKLLFSNLMEKWQNRKWETMPHGVPTLRHLNRCLRLNTYSIIPFELDIIKIQAERLSELNINRCNVCNSSKNLSRCNRCKSIWYCSVTCQKMDWRTHKKVCK